MRAVQEAAGGRRTRQPGRRARCTKLRGESAPRPHSILMRRGDAGSVRRCRRPSAGSSIGSTSSIRTPTTELHFQNAVRAARRDDPLGAVHRRAREPDHAGAVCTLSRRRPRWRAPTPDELEPQIQSTGFFRMKSRALRAMAQALVDRHRRRGARLDGRARGAAGRRPQDRQRRPGPRARRAGLPVDRHVLRVANRIGLVRSDDPVVVEAALTCECFRRSAGRARRTRSSCTAGASAGREPLCDRCLVRDVCDYFRRSGVGTAQGPEAHDRRGGSTVDDARRFRQLVDEALETIPTGFPRRDAEHRDRRSRTSRRRAARRGRASSRPTRCSGLYQGTPLTERQWAHGNVLPDKITLFQGPIEDIERRRRRRGRRDRRDAHPRDRALLRVVRRGDRGHRGAILAGRCGRR